MTLATTKPQKTFNMAVEITTEVHAEHDGALKPWCSPGAILLSAPSTSLRSPRASVLEVDAGFLYWTPPASRYSMYHLGLVQILPFESFLRGLNTLPI